MRKKLKISLRSQMWLPPVSTSIPQPNNSSASRGVMPNPDAEFSPLAMHRSMRALRENIGEPVMYDLVSRRADNVADEENFQGCRCFLAAVTAV